MGLLRISLPFALSLLALVAQGQETTVEVKVSPLGIPCEPSEATPEGSTLQLPCPAVDQQGYLVFLRTTDEKAVGFRTTVRYKTAEGEEKEAVQVAKRAEGEWTTDAFRIGRMKTEKLSGTEILEAKTEALESLE
jgi:hypothetical protein